MVALPVIKLIALGARQVTRPIVKRVVVRATVKQKLTYKVCIALGRLSLGLSSVIAEQSRKEATRQAHALTDAAHHKKASSSSSATSAATTTTTTTSDASQQGSSSNNNTTAAPADAETRRFMQEALAVASGADVKSPSAAAQYLANARHATTAHGGGGVSGGHGVTLAMATASPASTLPAAAAMASAMPSTMASVDASVVAAAVVNGSSGSNATAAATAAEANARTGAEAATVTPRSRSLMQNLFYGPQPYNKADEDDGSRPASPSSSTRGGHDADALLTRGDRRRGEVARLFIFQPYRSSWYVFRKTFFAPFPPQQLLDAGAELLVEVIVFAVLALALMWELRQQSANTAMKEARTEERMRAFEQKINELVRAQQQLQLLLQDHHHHGDDGHVVEAVHSSTATTAAAAAVVGSDDAETAALPTLHSNEVCVVNSSGDDSNNKQQQQQLRVCSTPRRMRGLSMMVSELPRSEVYVPPGRLRALLQSARSGVVAVADVVTAVGAAATEVVLSAVQSPAHVVTAAMLAPPSTATTTTTTTARDDDGNKVDSDDAASSEARSEHKAH